MLQHNKQTLSILSRYIIKYKFQRNIVSPKTYISNKLQFHQHLIHTRWKLENNLSYTQLTL